MQVDAATIIARMQDAVNIVLTSEHETSRVASCVFHPEHPDAAPASAVNCRPDCLKGRYPWDLRLGSSSQFVHAELAGMMKFGGPLRGCHVCVTDPFCPNCAKIMAEAGVRAIYIDHKGFQKDFIARNGDEFDQMSMLIAEKAGISVHVVNRKEGKVQPILAQATQTRPTASAIEFFDVEDGMTLESAMLTFRQRLGARETWAVGLVREPDGAKRGLLVFEALPPGITPDDFRERGTIKTGKYRFPINPLTRLLLTVRRMRFTWLDSRVGCSHVPSPRALINALGMGTADFVFASNNPDHDDGGIAVMQDLKNQNIITAEELP